MDPKVIWFLNLLLVVALMSTECLCFVGGEVSTYIPHWLGSAWAPNNARLSEFADEKYHGLCINIGPRLFIGQFDAVPYYSETYSHYFISPTPARIHNVHATSAKWSEKSLYRPVRMAPWKFHFFRRYDRKNANIPLFSAPFPDYETNKTHFGSGNCTMYGYSETINANGTDPKHERLFASMPVYLESTKTEESHIFEFSTRNLENKVCAGYKDVGSPIICDSEDGTKKLTFIVIGYEVGFRKGCHSQFWAYHVPHLVDSIQDIIENDKSIGWYDKQDPLQDWCIRYVETFWGFELFSTCV